MNSHPMRHRNFPYTLREGGGGVHNKILGERISESRNLFSHLYMSVSSLAGFARLLSVSLSVGRPGGG